MSGEWVLSESVALLGDEREAQSVAKGMRGPSGKKSKGHCRLGSQRLKD